MKKRKAGRSLVAAMMAVVLSMGSIPAVHAASSGAIREQIDDLEAQQEQIRQEYEAIQSEYRANENDILEMVSRKNVIDQEISLINRQISLLDDQIIAYSLLIADTQDELDEAEAELARLQAENKERVRAMEEDGKLSYWSVLFRASSFADLLSKLAMIDEIAAADQRRLDALNEAAARVTAVQLQLETEKSDLEATRSDQEKAWEQLAEKRQEADELLQELVARSEDYERMLGESEALQDQLMAEVAQLEDAYDKAKREEWLASSVPEKEESGDDTGGEHQAPSSSGWRCPLDSYVVTSPFGMRLHPTLGIYRMHNGIDMAAPRGTPIYAARSGQVTRAAYQEGGAGYYVSISHGDGFSSIYMHMTHYIVSAGDYVQQGQIIGYVGNSGGISTGNHLHFGISYNGEYVNPLGYI